MLSCQFIAPCVPWQWAVLQSELLLTRKTEAVNTCPTDGMARALLPRAASLLPPSRPSGRPLFRNICIYYKQGCRPKTPNTLRGPNLRHGKTQTEGWGTPRYVSRSQEPPQGPLHLWSRRHLDPGVPAARTHLGPGSSSRVACEAGDGEAGTQSPSPLREVSL